MKKSFVSVLMVGLLVFGLIGCSNPAGPGEEPKVIEAKYRGTWKSTGYDNREIVLNENTVDLFGYPIYDGLNIISIWTEGTELWGEDQEYGSGRVTTTKIGDFTDDQTLDCGGLVYEKQ
jgi:hypothetical protein